MKCRQVLADLPVLPFEDKFIEQAEDEPKRSII